MELDRLHEFTSIRDAAICRGTAIVAEDGGRRGIFTAGVLDAFLRAGFNPIELAVGASAGAQNLLTYFIGLPGYAKRAIAELSAAPSLLVPYRWLSKRGVLDLDTYFARLFDDPDYCLPCEEFDRLEGRRRLVFTATRRSDLTPVYLEPDAGSLLAHMKASIAVPFLYKGGAAVHGEILVDGAVADPVQVMRAYELGARRIVVIRTVPRDDTTSCWRQRMNSLGVRKAVPTIVSTMLKRHEQAYQEALRFIHEPPADLEIVQIAPDESLQSLVFGSQSEALLLDYAAGCRAGDAALESLHRWQRKPCPRHDDLHDNRSARYAFPT